MADAVITAAAVITLVAAITEAAGIIAQGSDLVFMRLTAMRLPFAIPVGSMTNMVFGESTPVARFLTATEIDRLRGLLPDLERRWSLKLGVPFESGEGSTAWVAPAELADGRTAVLKIAMPHMEAEHETAGLRFWNGDPTVRLIDADEASGALLLERCEPGTSLRDMPEEEQDVVIAPLLRRLWRRPAEPHPFRPLSLMAANWRDEALAESAHWADAGLIAGGLQLFEALAQPGPEDVLLATDLHAGNVLRAQRERWLVIDPKPFVGDPAYDATQHLLNCYARLCAEPDKTIGRIAGLLDLDAERVGLWLFARAAVAAGSQWQDGRWLELARVLRRWV
jgi:streptomycin 6-kinase